MCVIQCIYIYSVRAYKQHCDVKLSKQVKVVEIIWVRYPVCKLKSAKVSFFTFYCGCTNFW